jgi:hypothetical protein
MVIDQETDPRSERETWVWVFSGYGRSPHFPSGIFSSLTLAETWIQTNKLSGVLTQYPMDIGVYDWAILNKLFRPSIPLHSTPAFIQTFSSAHLEHHH